MWIFLLIVFLGGIGFWIFASRWLMRDLGEPEYRVLLRHDFYEVREYASQQVAEIDISGDMNQASHEGFSVLAGYLFGAQNRESISEESLSSCDDAQSASRVHTVAFVLPQQEGVYPAPHDPRIRLCTLAPRIVVAAPLGRTITEERIVSARERLENALEGSGLSCVGMSELVRHNPPFSFPGMLSHELLVEVRR